MSSNEKMQSQQGATTMKVVCALCFVCFSFCYLYYYQADVLAIAQHVLSDGVTSYNRLVGALLITFVLLLLQIGMFAVAKLNYRTHAVTYFPSFLLLTLITDISPDIDRHFSFGGWLVALPLLIILWIAVVYACRQFQPYEPQSGGGGFFSRLMWQNVLVMVVMMTLTCTVAGAGKAFHYRAHVETALLRGDYPEALATGRGSEASDSSLTMLRVYALSKQHKLGDELFKYHLTGGVSALLPNGRNVRAVMLNNKMIRRQVLHDKDYPIIVALMRRDLPRFVDELVGRYGKSGNYPKHYKEAFVLYNKITEEPKYRFSSPVIEADYDDMAAFLRSADNVQIRRTLLKDNYRGTYWEYYFW